MRRRGPAWNARKRNWDWMPVLKYLPTATTADYETNLNQLASAGFNPIFAVGYKLHDALENTAKLFPQTKFVLIDAPAPDAPNCSSLSFKEEQGAFLAGYLAASVSKTKVLGFVGGLDIPLIEKFLTGYTAGAKTAAANAKVLATYTGNWEDVNAGKSQADQQFASGADVIFQAAGKSGLGVINAAKEKGSGYYAIGVDSNQDDVAPGRVLTSMVKRLDVAVYDTIKQTQAGQFQPGPHIFDLKADGVGLTDFKYTKNDIAPDVIKKLDLLAQMVKAGKVTPPSTPEELAAFKPPVLP
ncbi:uncharacterized protein KY384_000079 [Bacidia gigantensis]|uniref:uncharacterized protein n=1 Tax=Bacidia gigantensis TaxID=2732470 RepID=UPI001D04397B|nr:uncharacterized protein KY384_000079 [Bacidia gigantensis]KAG8526087.1 hypothetical protein KY384_000079 [Bacidia gigantensis]